MMQKTDPSHSPRFNRTRSWLMHLARSEDGNLFIVFLPMLFIMMVWGGIAVDLMRFESRRATLQGVTDRATLAAANLDQSLDPASVVQDYFVKSGLEDSMDGAPIVTEGYKRREVSVKGRYDLDTFFMRHLNNVLYATKSENDFKTLSAIANSTAVQGVGAVEVSLVLDLSGSMYYYINGTTTRRIDKLRTAAVKFIETLLVPEYEDRISISLVPYSEHVNIGPSLFNELKVNQTHNFSHCIELPASSFTTTSFSTSTTYDQTQNIQTNAYGFGSTSKAASGYTRNTANPALDQPVCPKETFERIIPISQDSDELTTAIKKFQPRAGTSIFLGLKWGATLLDPSFQTTIAKLPSDMIDDAFVGRPEPYEAEAGANSKVKSLKYIVLMTDGYNDRSYRMNDSFYDDPSEIYYWAHHNLAWAMQSSNSGPDVSQCTYLNCSEFYTAAQGVGYMQSMCTAAKNKGIIIYAISMSGDDNDSDAVAGRTEMAKCASTTNHFFATSGAELDEIFANIAEQITDLRLTQ
ncbi:pilus assembly protein TadG-related protein [Loktanella salsilacus]|uniref:pilus assembly protein TadG-related protein n=1 Tax=Loktanella salsilacus TaxID=195913 RepID=UPI0037355AE0